MLRVHARGARGLTIVLTLVAGLSMAENEDGGHAVGSASQAKLPELPLQPVATLDLSQWELNHFSLAPDLTGDGVPEVVVARIANRPEVQWSLLAVVAPGPGRLLYCFRDYTSVSIPADDHGIGFGPDLDGDGVADLAVGAPERRAVSLVSGKSGKVLRRWTGSLPGFGTALAFGPDGDGDGIADLVVGAPGARKVELLSSKTGHRLRSWRGNAGFGRRVAYEQVRQDGAGRIALAADGEATVVTLASKAPVGEIVSRPRDATWPKHLAFAFDLTGDGTVDVSVGSDELTAILSGKDFQLDGTYQGRPAPDLDGDGRPDWILDSPLRIGRYLHGQTAPFHGITSPTPAMGFPAALTESKGGAALFDLGGRWLLYSNRDMAGYVPEQGTVLSLWALGHQALAPTPSPLPLALQEETCPLLWEPDLPLGPRQDASIRPMLHELADALTRLGAERATAGRRSAASRALAALADPVAGLWFWQNSGCCSDPTLRFPPAPKQARLDHALQAALSGAGELLTRELAQPRLASAIRRTRAVMMDLNRSVEASNDPRPALRDGLARLPLAVGVFLADDDDDAPARLMVFFTRRAQRLYLAHAIYSDGSA